MKRLITLFVLVAACVQMSMAATTFEEGYFKYEVYGAAQSSRKGTVHLTGFSEQGKSAKPANVVIPSLVTHDGKVYRVERIGVRAFRPTSFIKSVYITHGVTNIGSQAFDGCTNMTEIHIPSSVNYIGYEAFHFDIRLNKVDMLCPPEKLTLDTTAFPKSTTCKLYFPHTTYKGQIMDKPGLDNTRFASYHFSRDLYDYETSDGARVVIVDHPSDYKAPYGASIVDYPNKMALAPTSDGFTHDQSDREIKYVAIADSTFTDNTTIYRVDMSKCPYFNTVGNFAFSGCSSLVSVTMPSVENIGMRAFYRCTSLKEVNWGYELKQVGESAFASCPIQHDVVFPVGFLRLGSYAFSMSGVKKLVLPSTWTHTEKADLYGMINATQIYLNGKGIDKEFDLTGVYTNKCSFYFSSAGYDQAKGNSAFTWYNVHRGAYDFVNKQGENERSITVVSTQPRVVNGVRYDGIAKYVFNYNYGQKQIMLCDSVEVDKTFTSGSRKYLMTEIDDYCCYDLHVGYVALEDMTYLNRIGRYAFSESYLEVVRTPTNSRVAIGEGAFKNIPSLVSLSVPKLDYPITDFIGDNHNSFHAFIDHSMLGSCDEYFAQRRFKSDDASSDNTNIHISACVVLPPEGVMSIGAGIPLDFSHTGLDVYAATGMLDSKVGMLDDKQVNFLNKGEGAVIGGRPNEYYWIERWYYPTSTGIRNYLKDTGSPENSPTFVATSTSPMEGVYYWDVEKKRFSIPSSPWTVPSHSAYLLYDSNHPHLYLEAYPDSIEADFVEGDVNGDGVVDVTDVNLAINVMLGKSTWDEYPDSDVNGDGLIDVTDVNLIINIMLGK